MEPVIDLDALERELCRIPEVTAARVVASAQGDIEEVHILSLPSKHAKQVVRDVQSVAMATFNVDLDRRVVSVVQLDAVTTSTLTGPDVDDETDGTDGADDVRDHEIGLGFDEPVVATNGRARDRIEVDTVSAVRTGLQCTAQVILRRGEQRATGTAEGLVATSSILRLVSQATISALRQLEPAASRADVEAATMVALGNRSVALATVVIVVPPYEEVSSGSAVVRAAGELDAVARAVLDATNRRLPQLR